MPFSQLMFQQKLLEFIEVCNDGYAILSADDKMLGCNQAFCDIFYQDQRTIQDISFNDLMRLSYREGKGVRFEADSIEDWLAQAQGFIDGAKDDNYAVLAALLAAKDAVTLQQYDKAAEQLTWVLSHAKEPAILAVTQLRLARVQREQGKLDEALATLGTAVPESFASAQAELKGDILLLADKPAEAKAAYQQALTNAGQNSQLLQIKLDELAHITAV